MKLLLQKFSVLIIYLLVSATVFFFVVFSFSRPGTDGVYTCENLSKSYACSGEEALESAFAFAVIVQFMAQAVLFPAAVVLHFVHFFLKKRFVFFDEHPFWAFLIVFLSFLLFIGVFLFVDDALNKANSSVLFRYSA